MLNKLLTVIFIAVLGVGAYTYKDRIIALFEKPCEKPITYSLGSFDPRFNLSRNDFVSALKEAEDVWEKPTGRDLFNYTLKGGEVSVNLIYDYRQQTTNTLENIDSTIQVDEATYASIKRQYESLKASYDEDKVNYDAEVKSFNTELESYDQQVQAWNQSSRTSKSQFNDLQQQKASLDQESQTVKSTETSLNNKANQINTMVDQLNFLAKSLNINAKQYNTIGQSRGESFTGGLYESSSTGQAINIYEFENHAKLVRILAHELGHALGLDHVSDPKAIMYYLNEGDNPVATNADLSAVSVLCGAK